MPWMKAACTFSSRSDEPNWFAIATPAATLSWTAVPLRGQPAEVERTAVAGVQHGAQDRGAERAPDHPQRLDKA